MEHKEWKIVFSASSFHNNKVFLTLEYSSLTHGNFILILEKMGQKVNDSWDIGPSENPEIKFKTNQFRQDKLTKC